MVAGLSSEGDCRSAEKTSTARAHSRCTVRLSTIEVGGPGHLGLGSLGRSVQGLGLDMCILARMAAEVIMTEGIDASMTKWLRSD